MTEQEAIEYIENHGYISDDVKDMAIKALEKQIPKEIYHFDDNTLETSCCGIDVTNEDFKYCPECGQLLGGVEEIENEVEKMNVFEQIKQKEVSKKRIGRISFMEFLEVLDEVEKQHNNGWIPVDERLPDTNDYILLSFSNFTNPVIGRYEAEEDGGGAFYIGDELETCLSQDLFVNAWMELPEPYKESE